MTDKDFNLFLVNECENLQHQINMLKILLYDTNYQIKQLNDYDDQTTQSTPVPSD
jgi:hypothetical protein